MKYIIVCAFFIAAASALVRRDAAQSTDITQNLESIKKDLADLAAKINPDELKKVMTGATDKTIAALQDAGKQLEDQIKNASPTLKADYEALQKKTEDAIASVKDAIQKNSPDAIKKAQDAFETLTEKGKGLAAELEPQLKSLQDAAKKTFEGLTKAADDLRKQVQESI